MNKSKHLQTELRLKNDLFELKNKKMSTKMFYNHYSDIIKDEINENFSINVLITPIFQNSFSYHVIY